MCKFCTNCGAPVPEGGKFCIKCGTPVLDPAVAPLSSEPEKNEEPVVENPAVVQEEPVVAPSVYISEEPMNSFASTVKRKSRLGLWIVLGVVLVLAAVITCGILFFGKEDEPSSSSNGGESTEVSGGDSDGGDSDEGGSDSGDSNGGGSDKIDPKDISRTIMVYMVASDLESDYGAATLDLDEMCKSGFDTEKTNIVVYAGGTSSWKNELMTDREAGIYLIKDNDVEEIESSKSKNMGKTATLTSFLEYCEEEYPADRYNLILWDHGGGPMYGFGVDEVHSDCLTIDELSSALKKSPFGKNNKLESIGFDACLMGSVETAWIFGDYAEYFIASQEVEPGNGWDYSFLGDLDKCKDGADIGKLIIDSYFDYYEKLFEDYPRYESEITLSCVDLSKIDEVEEGIEELFGDVNDEVVKGEISRVSRCRYRSKGFGKVGSTSQYDLIDLKHITTLLSSEYEDECEELHEALEDYVIYSRSNVKNAHGVSIYHPYDDLGVASSCASVLEKIGFASDYAEYIRNFSDAIEEDTTSSGTFRGFSKTVGTAETSGQVSDISMQLTEEQAAAVSGVEYYILKKLPGETTFSKEEEYLHIFTGRDAVLSQDGTLSATYQGKAVFGKDLKTNKYSDMPLAMYQIYDGDGSEKYYFPCMFWHFGEDIADMNLLPVNWLMKFKGEKPTLLGAFDMVADEENKFPDKYLIDSEEYEIYTFANNSYFVQENSNGNAEFVLSGSDYGYEYTKENGFELELKDIDPNDGYYAVFAIEDIYGNTYLSDLIDLAQ